MAEGLFSKDEKSLLIARIARGKSCLRWRAAEEEPVVDKLMSLLDSTQQQFDLSSFRKEVKRRRDIRRSLPYYRLRRTLMCSQCGMCLPDATEYHPFVACELVEARHGDTTAARSDLQKVIEDARSDDPWIKGRIDLFLANQHKLSESSEGSRET
ncbi:MAG TPA: hypothetical protein VFJ76_07915 [Solirubrobacterales bacterium]|nr:hypothetical protein [Solirubrobacterales bacterium]